MLPLPVENMGPRVAHGPLGDAAVTGIIEDVEHAPLVHGVDRAAATGEDEPKIGRPPGWTDVLLVADVAACQRIPVALERAVGGDRVDDPGATGEYARERVPAASADGLDPRGIEGAVGGLVRIAVEVA